MREFVLILCIVLIGYSSAFGGIGNRELGKVRRTNGQGNMNMLFGGTKKKTVAKSVTIKVDGKEIIADNAPFNLRKTLQANKVDVYPFRTKLTGNCGGAGICGTCAVKVISGEKNMNPTSKNELNTLRGKPADFRLSCCSRVSGPIECKTKVW